MAMNGEHLGHMLLNALKKRKPSEILVIDCWTDSRISVGETLHQSVRLAVSLRRLALRPGDVLALAGRNHTALPLPYYAAIMNGLPVIFLNPFCTYDNIRSVFELTAPKIVFCQNESYDMYKRVSEELGIDLKIVTFDEGEFSLSKLLEVYGDDDHIDTFKPADFDSSKVYAWLVSTSGSTGVPKVAAIGHHAVINKFMATCDINSWPRKMIMNTTSPQWISSYNSMVTACLRSGYTILQTSRPGPLDGDHYVDIINKYRPTTLVRTPYLLELILRSEKHCDYSCFEEIITGGGNVYKETLLELRARAKCEVTEAYGLTETLGPITKATLQDPIGCVGIPIAGYTMKLVDPTTDEDITKPNVIGEAWVQGHIFTEFYKNPEETSKAFHERWYKTGDLMMRDEQDRYYFVERMKLVINYRNHKILPSELEFVIVSHPDVLDVAVTSVPHAEDGQRAVGCVVKRPGSQVTAQHIKDFIANTLPEEKHLHGGVMFLDKIPRVTGGSGKVDNPTLREMAQSAQIE